MQTSLLLLGKVAPYNNIAKKDILYEMQSFEGKINIKTT